MPVKAVLFDFDDTLAPELESFHVALRNAAQLAVDRHGIDPERLIQSALEATSDEWRQSELFATGLARGLSSHEVFSGSFREQGIGKSLQAESDRMRPVVWRRALDEQGIVDEALVRALDEASVAEGTGPHTPYPGVSETIEALSCDVPLAVVTNGDSNIQRRKVKRSGLERHFQVIVVSGDFGLAVAKPDPEPFLHALRELNVAPSQAVMVGNDEVNDIHGAGMLGMTTVWVNRTGAKFGGPLSPDYEITDMRELPDTLEALKT